MTLMLLLEMIVSAAASRVAVGSRTAGLTYAELHARAGRGAAWLRDREARHLVWLAPNDPALPVALFAAAWAGVPFVPLNYRSSREQLRALLRRHEGAVVIGGEDADLSVDDWQALTAGSPAGPRPPADADGDDVAVLLYTSGTTSSPKAVVLRHRHLVSYVLGSVELAAAGEDEAALVSLPPYHVAGIAAVVSNVYAGRRIVYLPAFSADAWIATARDETVTHAMVVPTMLARIVDQDRIDVPTLRTVAYGGARMPVPVLERALARLPGTDFVNAYGLTETSSTVAVLGPEDHRAGRYRGGCVGRVVPGVEVEVRDGEIWVRGDQVSGEYLGSAGDVDSAGWFPTRDRGWLDADGYLYVEGRADDTIIRGGENVAPAEIEDVLLRHPQVRQAAVVGIPDDEWGQRIAAVVVPAPGAELTADELRDWARPHLRTAKTPDLVELRAELPTTETGKVLRREILADLLRSVGGR